MARRKPGRQQRPPTAQRTLRTKAGAGSGTQALQFAVRHHGQGRLADAKAAYTRILERDPDNAQALHLLGVVHHQMGDNDTALTLISRALDIDPDYADAHGNLGHVLTALGRADAALGHFTRQTLLEPTLAEAHNNLGQALYQAGRLADAIDSYQMAVTLNPGFAEAHCNNGAAHQELGHLADALACYRHALQLRPGYAEALSRMGGALAQLGRDDEAVESYREAMRLNPADAATLANLTSLYISSNADGETAIDGSLGSLELLTRARYGDAGQATDDGALARLCSGGIAMFRLKHDLEQAAYLQGQGIEIPGIGAFRDAGQGILNRARAATADSDPDTAPVQLARDEAAALLPYLQSGYMYLSAGLPMYVLNPDIDWPAEETKYRQSNKQIMHIDDFLSPAALQWFQAYCLSSRVWAKEYRNKYLGAFSDQGFISPLHLKLAAELKEKMPALFGPHPLRRFWGFKYDARLGKGINVHADFAQINLNFWITPDVYNLAPGTGGLKVYDVPSPANWHFRAYNEGKEAIYKFIAEHKAGSVTVPYRCNRAVLFNSAYFHETDALHFEDVYEGRRINITYLFGSR